MAEMNAFIAAFLGALVMFLFNKARSTWKIGSSKKGRISKVLKENQARKKQAEEDARQGRKMQVFALFWGLLSIIIFCILVWILFF
jgi:hypothetical protein